MSSVNAFQEGFAEPSSPNSPQCPGQSGPCVSLTAYQMTPRSRRRSRCTGRELEGPRQVFRLALGPDGEPGGLPARCPADLGDPDRLGPVARAIQQAPQLLRSRQRPLRVGGVRMHGRLVEELCGAIPVKSGDEGGHVDAFRGGEEAAEQDACVGICAFHRTVEGPQHCQIAPRVRRRLPEVHGVRLVPELPVLDRPVRELGMLPPERSVGSVARDSRPRERGETGQCGAKRRVFGAWLRPGGGAVHGRQDANPVHRRPGDLQVVLRPVVRSTAARLHESPAEVDPEGADPAPAEALERSAVDEGVAADHPVELPSGPGGGRARPFRPSNPPPPQAARQSATAAAASSDPAPIDLAFVADTGRIIAQDRERQSRMEGP